MLVAASLGFACDGESSVAKTSSGVDGQDPEGDPESEGEIGPYQVAWEGGSRPGLEVWKPDPAGPDDSPASSFGDSFIPHLSSLDSTSILVVHAAVAQIGTEFWDQPPSASGWLGPSVVTRLDFRLDREPLRARSF